MIERLIEPLQDPKGFAQVNVDASGIRPNRQSPREQAGGLVNVALLKHHQTKALESRQCLWPLAQEVTIKILGLPKSPLLAKSDRFVECFLGVHVVIRQGFAIPGKRPISHSREAPDVWRHFGY
jgi:hypothetical protein